MYVVLIIVKMLKGKDCKILTVPFNNSSRARPALRSHRVAGYKPKQ